MANTSIRLIIPMKLEKPGKALHLLYRRRWHIPNKSPFDRPISVQCLNSTYDSKMLTMVL